MLQEAECKDLVGRVLEMSGADELQVELEENELAHQRFARNAPSTAGLISDRAVGVRATFGTRSASVRGNRFDDEGLRTLVARAEELARLAPEDPEFLPALGPQEYGVPPAEKLETESERLGALADGVANAIGEARRAGLVAAGFTSARAGMRCLATSAGLFGYHRFTDAHFSETVRTADGKGSGWGSSAATRAKDLDFAAPSRVAIEKARGSVGARQLAPGDYPAILEPACVANLLQLFVRGLDARRADEGRSFFSLNDGRTRVGEALFPASIRVHSDPGDPRLRGLPWSGDGRPHRPVDWIEDGVLRNLHCSRFWARKTDRPSLARPSVAVLEGGDASVDDLIAGAERAVLVTNLWYIRSVDPKTMLYTGLTRDGVFWVENGKVSHPVNNFRWNDSPIRVLKNVEALSRPRRIGGRGGRLGNLCVPAVKVGAFGFSSISEAV